MQISKVNTAIPKKLTKQSQGSNRNNINNTTNINAAQMNRPSFKGGGLDSFCLGLANLIETGGLFVSFTIQDMLGTNLPRPLMGLRRNAKENKGESNKSFAAKELVREMLTGPSMFIIPGAMLKIGKPLLGKSINTPARQIKALGDIHAANPSIASREDLFKYTFAEIFKNAKVNENDAMTKAGEFAKKLAESTDIKETVSELADDFVNIAKQHADDAAHTDFTKAALSSNASASFKDITSGLLAYADDVVDKTKGKSAEYIKKLADKKVLTRVGTNIVMYAAVLGFLTIIPKLYNKAEGKGNSGLKGLMKEETINDKSLEKNKDNKNKSNPSFGSANTISDIANKVTSNTGIGKFFKGFEFSGCNVSFPMLLGIMTLGILLPRTINAKDKYDREEILRRDLVTCATMCFAEKELQKGFSKLNEATSGFVLASKDAGFKNKSLLKRFFDYIRPINGVKVMTTEQIKSKYSGLDKYKEGIKGFCDFISGQGGNLGKVFSLTEDSKNIVNGLLAREGQNIATADNKTITRILDQAKDSDEVKALIEQFKDKNNNNPWIKKARTLNARFTALSVLILVPVFLGFLLPAINERATKRRIREEQKLAEVQKTAQINPALFISDIKTSNIFKDIEII